MKSKAEQAQQQTLMLSGCLQSTLTRRTLGSVGLTGERVGGFLAVKLDGPCCCSLGLDVTRGVHLGTACRGGGASKRMSKAAVGDLA